MKYLDYPELESLSRALTFESAECKVFTRIEAYSCKAVKRERQLFKTVESNILQNLATSPFGDEKKFSAFGPLDNASARKTLFLLIATLNGAFPDHDFSGVHTADFKRESNSDSVLSSLGTTLLSLRSNSNAPRSFSSFPSSYDDEKKDAKNMAISPFSPGINNVSSINHPQLAAVLDDIMCIPDCEVYSFHPDAESDPHACAEPDEEGEELNDDRFADDEDDEESWSDEYAQENDGLSTAVSTPKHHHHHHHDDDNEDVDDAPIFDEDLIGTGFTPSSSQFTSRPNTPRTPSSTRARAGDFFTHQDRSKKRTTIAQSTSLSSSDSFPDDDDVDGDGLHGLLWATYAFFYNRKLKRILFVSVWSRRNNASYSFSPSAYPSMAYSQPILSTPFSLDHDGFEEVVGPSPAKRAIAKSTAKSQHRRSISSSPAPSALSPFPHAAASVQIGSKLANSESLTSPLVKPIEKMTIADALKQGSTTTSSGKRGVDGSSAEHSEPSREQIRKQRKVATPSKPLAA
ncbi:hypothetical protein CBS101457_000512 [Exobasidium rhododendri]|nr:hypothetical protein CBS101457_000512 [Exobasidium rhododendri]